jgi:hypothetical protein
VTGTLGQAGETVYPIGRIIERGGAPLVFAEMPE